MYLLQHKHLLCWRLETSSALPPTLLEPALQLPLNIPPRLCPSVWFFQLPRILSNQISLCVGKESISKGMQNAEQFPFPSTQFARDNPVSACGAFQQQNDAVHGIPPPCLSCHLQNLVNASGFAFFGFSTNIHCASTESLQQTWPTPSHEMLLMFFGISGKRSLQSASAFCL